MSEPTRKLAAIVFTDIVGFTKLTADDQSKASSLLKQQRELLKPIVVSFNGKWVKEIGDGLLLIFDTVTDAVKCSIKIQEETKRVDNLDLRIGIHQGEILLEENDVIGDDVNVAARIEPFAASGGIAITNKVHDAIIREKEFETKYLGKPKLKGVGQKVEVYCITSHGLPETDLSKVSAKMEREGIQWNIFSVTGAVLTVIGVLFWINISFLGIGIANEGNTLSIAILPFENKGSDQDDFYAYGISSDLISDITSSGLIRVASLGDIEKLDYNQISNSELSNKLFVRYVAKGTLWKMDSIFQLSMEIFDTELSKVVYSNRWQTNWKDLAIIKDDLSKNILESLKIEVVEDVEALLSESDPAAYEYYLRAKHQYKKRNNTDDTEIAQGLLEKAIDLDSNLVEARLLLGNTYRDWSDYDEALNIYKKARFLSERLGDKKKIVDCNSSISTVFWMKGELDSILSYHKNSYQISTEMNNKYYISQSLNNIGWSYLRKSEYDSTIIYFEHALELFRELDDKEGIGQAYSSMGTAYSFLGNNQKAIQYKKESLEIYKEVGDKGKLSWSYLTVGWEYNQDEDYENAIQNFEKALELAEELDDKNRISAIHYNLAYSYTIKEDYARALEAYDISAKISEELGDKNMVGYIMKDMGSLYYKKMDLDNAFNYFSKSNKILLEVGNKHGISRSLIQMGDVYSLIGKYNEALEYYSNALEMNNGERRFIMTTYYRLGKVWFYKENKSKALEHFENYLDLRKEILEENIGLSALTLISLTYKQVGKEYDVQEIDRLISESDEISYSTHFLLYKLLNDSDHLNKAYDKTQEKAEKMENELKEKFFSYPIPKQIKDYHSSINS